MATTEDEKHEITIPPDLPMLAVRDVVVFPNMVLRWFVGRETSVLAIEAALAQDRLIFLATKKINPGKPRTRRYLPRGHGQPHFGGC